LGAQKSRDEPQLQERSKNLNFEEIFSHTSGQFFQKYSKPSAFNKKIFARRTLKDLKKSLTFI